MRGDPDVTEVDITVKGQDEPVTLPCDKLVAALGFTANLGPLMEWGIDIQKRQIMVDTTGRTTVPGIYAAGDIVDYDGKVKLIATGFGEVATAVNNASAYPQPGQVGVPGAPVRLRAGARRGQPDGVADSRVRLIAVLIVGVGIDVVPVERFAESLARTPALADRLFTAGRAGDRVGRAAHAPNRSRPGSPRRRRWPRRSAAAAACCGPTPRCSVDDAGRPSLAVRGTVRSALPTLGVTRWHVSLSHDGGIAVGDRDRRGGRLMRGVYRVARGPRRRGRAAGAGCRRAR